MNTELDPNKLEQLKEIYVDAKVNQMSYETLIDYVKADFYQDVEKYTSLDKKLYNYYNISYLIFVNKYITMYIL